MLAYAGGFQVQFDGCPDEAFVARGSFECPQ
jgi:hypothetical protein